MQAARRAVLPFVEGVKSAYETEGVGMGIHIEGLENAMADLDAALGDVHERASGGSMLGKS